MAGALSLCDDALGDGDTLVISGSGGGLGHLGLEIASNPKNQKHLNIIAIDTGSVKQKAESRSWSNGFYRLQNRRC